MKHFHYCAVMLDELTEALANLMVQYSEYGFVFSYWWFMVNEIAQ
jgi:hypothetical protein